MLDMNFISFEQKNYWSWSIQICWWKCKSRYWFSSWVCFVFKSNLEEKKTIRRFFPIFFFWSSPHGIDVSDEFEKRKKKQRNAIKRSPTLSARRMRELKQQVELQQHLKPKSVFTKSQKPLTCNFFFVFRITQKQQKKHVFVGVLDSNRIWCQL